MGNRSHLMLNILLLALLWSPSFLCAKISVLEIPPISIVTLRIAFSALLLLAILKMKNIPIPRDFKLWKQCFMMGVVASSVPFILFCLSLEYIDSSLCSLINGTTPIITILLANYFLKDEKLTVNRLTGILLGFTGFVILFLPSILAGSFSGDSVGMLYSLGASCCYAIGMVYARKNIIAPTEPLVLPTLQLLSSLIYLIPLSLFIDPSWQPLQVSLSTWAAIGVMAFLGTTFAFIVYYKIIIRHGATSLSTVTYILPLFSTTLGVIFLDEALSLPFCMAALCILLGTMVANGLIPLEPLLFWRRATQ
jgi:drug/metabolite transporter (DMT)-like permease